jgi:transketolase
MTMPDRILAASAALAQPSRFPATATSPTARAEHDHMANAIRALAMDAVERAKAGHPGLPLGAADIATVLFTRFLKFDPSDPDWPDRDRFVLSAGHGSMLIYALLHLLGYE